MLCWALIGVDRIFSKIAQTGCTVYTYVHNIIDCPQSMYKWIELTQCMYMWIADILGYNRTSYNIYVRARVVFMKVF